ncbi:hypothetical protein HK405_008618 [Cladochytrium tenue]|nr:hypothetical protein HK405_008618 [Cladochytrium tenue]
MDEKATVVVLPTSQTPPSPRPSSLAAAPSAHPAGARWLRLATGLLLLPPLLLAAHLLCGGAGCLSVNTSASLLPVAASGRHSGGHASPMVHQPSDRAIATGAGTNASVPLATAAEVCPQEPPRAPTARSDLEDLFTTQYDTANTAFGLRLAEKLAGMVRIRTESFDDMAEAGPPAPEPLPDADPRRAGLTQLRAYLADTWPRAHDMLRLDVVNRYALVYTWEGEDPRLRPLVLAAHQDTVPVPAETLSRWTYPPFAGVIDTGRVWGRGSSDCKAQMTAILDAVEALVSAGFAPRRTVVLAFGFDEEISGRQGAGEIAKLLEARLAATGGAALVLDEGGMGIEPLHGAPFVMPGTSEKGFMNLHLSVATPGGHSSVPPDHTGIGLLARLVVQLENRPFPPSLGSGPLDEPALLDTLRCAAAYGPDMPEDLRRAVFAVDAATDPEAGHHARRVLAGMLVQDPVNRALISTTQAVDIVAAGVKANALPELSRATINYRIASDSSVAATEERLFEVLAPEAARLNLSLRQRTASGRERAVEPPTGAAPVGSVLLETAADSLEPSPRTSPASPAFRLLAATARHALRQPRAELLRVAPAGMTGNTDTRYYHGLSENVVRFSPLRSRRKNNIHTVDESCSIPDLQVSSGFFFELIRNFDEADV